MIKSPPSFKATVTEVIRLSENILGVTLTPKHYHPYVAGQYLQVIINNEPSYFSIANAPNKQKHYCLQIRLTKDSEQTATLLKTFTVNNILTLIAPEGLCHLGMLAPKKPILFIAGGTGLAPIAAMIEQLLLDKDARPFELYWGVRNDAELYFQLTLFAWQQQQAFPYYPCHTQSVYQSLIDTLCAHHEKNLADYQVVISGPFDMVFSIAETLLAKGALKQDLHADAFQFLPN